MIAKDWSASELRAMVAILIEELDSREDEAPCDGTLARLVMRGGRSE